MFGFDHPWFRPLWRRVAVVVLCLGWGAVEVATGSAFWALGFLAMGGVAAYALLLTYTPPGDD